MCPFFVVWTLANVLAVDQTVVQLVLAFLFRWCGPPAEVAVMGAVVFGKISIALISAKIQTIGFTVVYGVSTTGG